MALRDRLARPAATAIPAISATLGPSKAQATARIAKIAAIATSQGSADEAEIRALLAREMRGAGADHPDYPEALRIALADPGAALEALRSNCGRARNG